MDVIDETKLRAAADEVVERAASDLAQTLAGAVQAIGSLLAQQDGWTLTVEVPPITIRLSKPEAKP